jgi:hypothetical protein
MIMRNFAPVVARNAKVELSVKLPLPLRFNPNIVTIVGKKFVMQPNSV